MSEQLKQTLKEIDTKLGVISGKVIEMEAYQKTHWTTLQKHDEKLEDMVDEEKHEKLEKRVRANEKGMVRANTLYAIGLTVVTAWAVDIASIFTKSGQ